MWKAVPHRVSRGSACATRRFAASQSVWHQNVRNRSYGFCRSSSFLAHVVGSALGGLALALRPSWSSCEDSPGKDEGELDVDAALIAVRRILSDSKYGFLVTFSDTCERGTGVAQPRGRIVEVQSAEGLLQLWICTNQATRKIVELQQHSRVGVLVWHAESMSSVELHGRAKILKGESAKERWPGDDWFTFFPEGPDSPRYCAIEISVDQIEVVSVGHGIALGEDPGHWYPPLSLTRMEDSWSLKVPSESRVQSLRHGPGSTVQDAPRVAVLGTLNPGKMEACERCFMNWSDSNFSLQGVSVPSGVSEQPMGLEETMLGARNRAVAAKSKVPSASVGIGLESGLVVVDGLHIDFCACAVYDGEHHYVGFSSGWVLPPQVAATFAGRGYNQAFEDIGIPADDKGAGVLGQLSGGILSRPKQMQESINMALLQFRNKKIYAKS